MPRQARPRVKPRRLFTSLGKDCSSCRGTCWTTQTLSAQLFTNHPAMRMMQKCLTEVSTGARQRPPTLHATKALGKSRFKKCNALQSDAESMPCPTGVSRREPAVAAWLPPPQDLEFLDVSSFDVCIFARRRHFAAPQIRG